jgi:hypothetical protein
MLYGQVYYEAQSSENETHTGKYVDVLSRGSYFMLVLHEWFAEQILFSLLWGQITDSRVNEARRTQKVNTKLWVRPHL